MKNFTLYFKHTIFLFFTLLFAFSSQGQAPTFEWQNTIGGSEQERLFCIQQTSDGGYILGGDSRSDISGDKTENSQGVNDYWVVKLDATGAIQWQKTIGGSLEDILVSIQETSDGGYILGGYSRSDISGDKTENTVGGYNDFDYWIVKLNASGSILWQNTIGGIGMELLRSVQETSDGGYILGGSTNSSISGDVSVGSNGLDDFWVVKLNSTGVIQWQNTIGGSDADYIASIQQTNDGGYIVGGYSQSNISGDKTENSLGGYDYWVVKLNGSGVIQWQNTIGGASADFLHSIQQTSDGGFILGGRSNSDMSGDKTENSLGGEDYWLVKLNSTGVIQWQNTIGGSAGDQLASVDQTSDGGFIIGGTSSSNISGDKIDNSLGGDYWVLRLNSTGVIQWQTTMGGSSGDNLNSIQQTNDGGYILGGTSFSNLSGEKTENNLGTGTTDYWVVKISDPVVWTANIWTGNTSTDWHISSNWSSGVVPNSNDTILITNAPAGGVFPITNADITVDSLTIELGANLTIGTGQGLIIGTDGSVINNGTITLRANATGTAWLDDFTNTSVTYTGKLTAQQYVATGSALGQRMFGSPVENGRVFGLSQTYASGSTGQIVMTLCDSAQVTAASPYNNLFEWHEDAVSPNNCEYEAWFARLQTDPLDNGRGYSGWMNSGSVISFTGTPNTGNISYGGFLGNSGSGLINKDGWHVLSNPYPSSANINALTSANWSSPQTYDASVAFGGTFQPVTPGQDLAVAQGFVMKTDVNNNTANFTNAMRTQGSNQFKSNNDWFDAKLDIEVSNGTSQDITYIYFNNDATQAFDNQWDCEKRDSDAGIPTLYTSTTGMNTSLNGNNLAELGDYSFPMGLKPGSDNSFTFTVDGINTLPYSTLVYLEDKATGTWTNLREQNTYSFNMTTQEVEDRFEVHFTKPLALAFNAESCEGNDGNISIDFGNQSIAGNLQTWDYEIDLASTVIASGSEANFAEIVDLQPGDYEIIFTNGNLQASEWITVEDKAQVEADFDANATTLYVGDELNLSNHSNGATSFEWEVNGEFFSTNDLSYTFSAPGTYVVSLRASNADCEAFMEQSFIVNEKTTGIAEQIELDKVLVYTKGNNIIVDLSNTDLKGQTDLEVYNALGQLLIQELDIEMIEEIEMANQARGYYFVNIINQEEQISKKVILK